MQLHSRTCVASGTTASFRVCTWTNAFVNRRYTRVCAGAGGQSVGSAVKKFFDDITAGAKTAEPEQPSLPQQQAQPAVQAASLGQAAEVSDASSGLRADFSNDLPRSSTQQQQQGQGPGQVSAQSVAEAAAGNAAEPWGAEAASIWDYQEQTAVLLGASTVQEVASLLESQFSLLAEQATALQQQATAGEVDAFRALEALELCFLNTLNLVREVLVPGAAASTNGSGSNGSSTSSSCRELLLLLDKAQVDATVAARALEDAASAQQLTAASAVTRFSVVLLQLKSDVAERVVAVTSPEAAGAARALLARAQQAMQAAADSVAAAAGAAEASASAAAPAQVQAAAAGPAALPDGLQATAVAAQEEKSTKAPGPAAQSTAQPAAKIEAIATDGAGSGSSTVAATATDALAAVAASESPLPVAAGDVASVAQLAGRTLVAAEQVADSLQQLLPLLKQQHKGDKAAAAALFSSTVEEVAEQLQELAVQNSQSPAAEAAEEALARLEAGGDITAAGSSEVQIVQGLQQEAVGLAVLDLKGLYQSRGEQLLELVQARELSRKMAYDQLLWSLKAGIAGPLRSSLLDVIAASSAAPAAAGGNGASATAAAAMPDGSDGDVTAAAAQLAAAVAAARAEAAAAAEAQAAAAGLPGSVSSLTMKLFKVAVGLGVLQLVKLAADAAAGQVTGIQGPAAVMVPSAVLGMLGLTGLLLLLGHQTSAPLVQFYDNHVSWTITLLPLFYSPALAVLPSMLQGMPGKDLAGLLGVSLAGMAATLIFTAKAAQLLLPNQSNGSTHSITRAGSIGLARTSTAAGRTTRVAALLSVAALLAVAPLAITKHDPVAFGGAMAGPVGAAWSLLGFVLGRVAGDGRVSPLLLAAVGANVGVAWHAQLVGWDGITAMSVFFGQGLGAGELLMLPVAVSVIGLAFVIVKYKNCVNLAAVAATTVLSAAFTLASTLGVAHVLGVSPDWAKALIPRSVTGGLAIDIARAIGGHTECAGLAVLLQAAMTAALGPALLNVILGLKLVGLPGPGAAVTADGQAQEAKAQAAAGVAAGCTAGGIGVAALGDQAPVAVANGALSYAMMGLLSCAVVGLPAARQALLTAVAAAVPA